MVTYHEAEQSYYNQCAEDDRRHAREGYRDETYDPNAPAVFRYETDEIHRRIEAKVAADLEAYEHTVADAWEAEQWEAYHSGDDIPFDNPITTSILQAATRRSRWNS